MVAILAAADERLLNDLGADDVVYFADAVSPEGSADNETPSPHNPPAGQHWACKTHEL